jgi:hypothetical protein
MRMSMRRFTRLTNGFSKKIDNHGHAVALHFMYYHFVRVHQDAACPGGFYIYAITIPLTALSVSA